MRTIDHTRRGRRRRTGLARTFAFLPLLALALSACTFGEQSGATAQGQDMAHLYQLLFWTAIPVAGIVYLLIFWSIIRYRARGEDRGFPKQTRYHVPLEVTYTVIPVLIVIGLFIATYRTEAKVDAVVPHPAVVVNVSAYQWQWSFDYPSRGYTIFGTPRHFPTMVVPAGETVQINLVSQDVVHGFYVPAFLFQRLAIPGVTNRFDFRVDRPGVWRGQCTYFCGIDHAQMIFYVRALPPAQFQQWLAAQRPGITTTGGATA